MRIISEEASKSFLAKSTQKKLQPEAAATPEDLLVVGETNVTKGKMKNRSEVARSSDCDFLQVYKIVIK
ncbi:hypothetical protein A2U01_0080853 [Trifolium medium]|uniref:Uncharacterized protein n=1 Tax=Trifolium medium TaxID=97028 RepID=A0A392TF21_9FABA|nr:hypothetical protein [Trifolium medium]